MENSQNSPFRVPTAAEVPLVQERERQKSAEERERANNLPVWEKTTVSSRVHTRGAPVVLGIVGDDEGAADPSGAPAAASTSDDARRDKESLPELIAKKREMLLMQMSIDVNKSEMLRVDQRTKQKDEALHKSAQTLDADAARFDELLKSSDQKAHKAIKSAEEMSKKKQDKQTRIKQLQSELSVVQAEMVKQSRQNVDLRRYMDFLLKLTPEEWTKEQAAVKRSRKVRRREAWVDEQVAASAAVMQAELDAEDAAFEERAAKERYARRKPPREAAEQAAERQKGLEEAKSRIQKSYPTLEEVQEHYEEVSSGEEAPMYFERPQQLLDIFAALEESSLSLIQSSQLAEQTMAEAQRQLAEVRQSCELEDGRFRRSIAALELELADEGGLIEELGLEAGRKHDASEGEILMQDLATKVGEVQAACGFEPESEPDILCMLGSVETKLEELLCVLDEAEAAGFSERVRQLEVEREKIRRETVRRQRKEEQDRRNEERLKASLLRAQAPVHKKIGKPVMFRSAPLARKRKVVQDDGFDKAQKEHDLFGIWINKDRREVTGSPSFEPLLQDGSD